MKDHLLFISRWLRAPGRIGAVAPSGKALAKRMVDALDITRPGTAKDTVIVELGAGTGPMTRQMLASGLAPERLVIVELDPGMCHLLRERFPNVRVLHGNAADLPGLLTSKGITSVGGVLSSLPLLCFPQEVRRGILSAAFAVMPPDGHYIQFSYGRAAPIPAEDLSHLGLTAERIGPPVWANLPPARVWKFLPAQPQH